MPRPSSRTVGAGTCWSIGSRAICINVRAKPRRTLRKTLPSLQSDLARETLKDPYKFEFLTLSNEAEEQELERGLVAHIRQFLLELGAGFSFVGQQVHLKLAARTSISTFSSTTSSSGPTCNRPKDDRVQA